MSSCDERNARLVVIGYGNPASSDDGVGWHAVEQLRGDPRFSSAVVISAHQLTPELVDEIAGAEAVVLIDASIAAPGVVVTTEVAPADPGAWTHHLEPGALLGLARELHGRVPRTHVVTVGAASLDPGFDLSPAVTSALPALVEAVARCAFAH